MQEEAPKKKYWVSTFYWMKPPPRPSPLQTGFANRQQKVFYFAMTALKIAKLLAIVLVALFLLGRL